MLHHENTNLESVLKLKSKSQKFSHIKKITSIKSHAH